MLNSRDCDGTLSLDRAHESIVIADAAAQIAISILFRNIAYTNELVFYVLHLSGDYCRPTGDGRQRPLPSNQIANFPKNEYRRAHRSPHLGTILSTSAL